MGWPLLSVLIVWRLAATWAQAEAVRDGGAGLLEKTVRESQRAPGLVKQFSCSHEQTNKAFLRWVRFPRSSIFAHCGDQQC